MSSRSEDVGDWVPRVSCLPWKEGLGESLFAAAKTGREGGEGREP